MVVIIFAYRDFDNLDFNVTYEIPLEAGATTQRETVKKGTQVACQPLSQARKSLPCILLIGRWRLQVNNYLGLYDVKNFDGRRGFA